MDEDAFSNRTEAGLSLMLLSSMIVSFLSSYGFYYTLLRMEAAGNIRQFDLNSDDNDPNDTTDGDGTSDERNRNPRFQYNKNNNMNISSRSHRLKHGLELEEDVDVVSVSGHVRIHDHPGNGNGNGMADLNSLNHGQHGQHAAVAVHDIDHDDDDMDDDKSIVSVATSVISAVSATAHRATVLATTKAKEMTQDQSSKLSVEVNHHHLDDGIAVIVDEARRMQRISSWRRLVLAGITATIMLLVFLLLVMVPYSERTIASDAHLIFWSWIALLAVTLISLRYHISDEIHRCHRLDRLSSLLTLLLLSATSMNLAAYSHYQEAAGDVYYGAARIVGYDSSSYTEGTTTNNNKNKQKSTPHAVTRTDLQVSWGGTWGCPNDPHQICVANVDGALCESSLDEDATEVKVETEEEIQEATDIAATEIAEENVYLGGTSSGSSDISYHDGVVGYTSSDDEYSSERGNNNHNNNNNNNDNNNNNNNYGYRNLLENTKNYNTTTVDTNNNSTWSLDNVTALNEQLVEENTELEAENEVLQSEVDGLSQDLNIDQLEINDEEYLLGEEENELDAYYYQDDHFYNEYWNDQDWSAIWGDYACYDLFNTDLEGSTFDSNQPPGPNSGDDWPFINIYGNCRTCEAYIVDYFSTQHFQSIAGYRIAARNYGIAFAFSLLATTYLTLKHRKSSPGTTGKEIELLSSAGGFGGALA
jgi:hypothetical protein